MRCKNTRAAIIAGIIALVGLSAFAGVERLSGDRRLEILFSGDDYGNVKPCG